MKIVFCTTCRGRLQHLERTLPQNLLDNPDSTFVVLGYNDQTGLAEYMMANHTHDMDAGRVAFYEYREPVKFQMAHAKNLAHRLGIMEGGDVLVNLDADNFAGPGFADWVREVIGSPDATTFLWSRMVKDGDGRLPRGVSGRIAVTKAGFLVAGGYDEKYSTHSPDDKDFNARLRRLGYDAVEVDQRFLNAIRHNDKLRFRDYPQAKAFARGEESAIEPQATVVNAGRVGCGTVWRNFSGEPVHVDPIPTRIFGVGMQKTGTTSLHHALQTLGFKSAHWQTAPWAKRVWREATQDGISPTLERFYAASDLPIPLVFRELDRAYPGSKFILTVRDEWKWLRSVHHHWDPARNPFRAGWDTDVFSHRAHNLCYGRRDFDATVFLERYRRHNAEVINHFQSRPEDLLVMDLDQSHGWKELCEFLKAPAPSIPYPHLLKTRVE